MDGAKPEPGRRCAGCGLLLSRYNNGDYCRACVSSDQRSQPGQDSGMVAVVALNVGARLHALRLRRGMTLEVLAGLAGVAPSYLSMIENGKRRLDRYSTIISLAAALRVPPAELAPGMPDRLLPALDETGRGDAIAPGETAHAKPLASVVNCETGPDGALDEFAGKLRRLMAVNGLGVRAAARRVPCNAGYISNMANGRKKPSRNMAARLDDLLGANGELVACLPEMVVAQSISGASGTGSRVSISPLRAAPGAGLTAASWAAPIYNAVLNPTDTLRRAMSGLAFAGSEQLCDPRILRGPVANVMRASLSSAYPQLTQWLPGLIGRAELAKIQSSESDYFGVRRLLSDVYAVAGWTLIKADSPAVAWVAAQRAFQAADRMGDAVRCAAALRCLSEVHMRAGDFDEASRTALLAYTYLDAARPTEKVPSLSIRGAVLLSAAAAAARRGDSQEAYKALDAASSCATELGEDRSDLGTVFGPTNVAIHRVAIAIELGNAREAISYIPIVKLERMPAELTERRTRYLIDVARSYAQIGDDSAALAALIEAEKIAPYEARNHRLTGNVLRDLLSREHRSSGVRALADRCKVLD